MPPRPRGIDAHYAIAAVAVTVLINRRKDLKLIPGLLQPNGGKTKKMLIGTGGIFVFEQIVRKALAKAGIKLPSSLVSMVLAFILLKAYESSKGKEEADKVADYFGPAVEHLGKWMPLYLAPPLIVLPNALSEVKGAAMWARLGGVHVVGWALSILSTAAVAKATQNASDASKPPSEESGAGGDVSTGGSAEAVPAEPVGGVQDAAAVGDMSGEGAGCGSSAAAAGEEGGAKVKSKEEKAADMRKAWAVITAATYALLPWCEEGPAAVSTTVLSLLHANALPPGVKKILHPLVVCSLITGGASYGLGAARDLPLKTALEGYFPKAGMVSGGAGDLFFGVLNASCCALGFRMFYNRDILSKNLRPLLASTLWSSMTSLFGTAAAAGAVGLTPRLSMTLTQRSVMSSLGIPAASLLGGNPALAVASILVTGVYGASVGTAVLDAMGVGSDNLVPRGIAMGASAHSIGTAALMEREPEAAAVASVALCLAGIFHTAVCAAPPAQRLLRVLALDR
ncbi:unnamed protein product [Ectocarpus sp. 12 AP-2014]